MKALIKKAIKWLYKKFIRPAIKEAINNPDSDLDEWVIDQLDKLFGYTPKK